MDERQKQLEAIRQRANRGDLAAARYLDQLVRDNTDADVPYYVPTKGRYVNPLWEDEIFLDVIEQQLHNPGIPYHQDRRGNIWLPPRSTRIDPVTAIIWMLGTPVLCYLFYVWVW